MQGIKNLRVTDADFNAIFTRNHGAESEARVFDAATASDLTIHATYRDLTATRNYGHSARKRGAE